MNIAQNVKICKVTCEKCPLQEAAFFRAFTPEEARFMTSFKAGELNVEPGATILVEQSHSAHLYSVLQGTAFRYKTLEDGRRQIMNFLFPGDLIGLQGSLTGEMQHSVETLSPVILCVFERNRLAELYREFPSLAYDITWMAAREEQILDESILNVGRRSALERAAYLIAYLYARARAVGLVAGPRLKMPVTQSLMADTLGLSVVHTNRTLKRLSGLKLIRWRERGCEILDEKRLLQLAQWDGLSEQPRPYL